MSPESHAEQRTRHPEAQDGLISGVDPLSNRSLLDAAGGAGFLRLGTNPKLFASPMLIATQDPPL